MKNEIHQTIDNFDYIFPANEKIVGLIMEDSEGFSGIVLKPDTQTFDLINKCFAESS